jgi:hypothetical protein
MKRIQRKVLYFPQLEVTDFIQRWIKIFKSHIEKFCNFILVVCKLASIITKKIPPNGLVK